MYLNQNIKFKQAKKVLTNNGFALARVKGSHYHYTRDGTRVVINIKLNPCVWYRICKDNNLKEV